MNKNVLKASILCVIGLASGQASAHVGYGSALYSGAGVYDPLTNTTGAGTYAAGANFSATVSSNAGYLTGLDPVTLGNTHDIRFRYFTLDSNSKVSFTINGLANATVSGNVNPALNGLTADTLNPAFSLYQGVVPASSHDGVGDVAAVAADPDTAALLASEQGFASWSPFAAVNPVISAAGGGSNPVQWGVFDTDGNITTGNNGTTGATDTHGPNYLGGLDTPKVAAIHYTGISGADAAVGATFSNSLGNLQSVLNPDGTVDNIVSWTGFLTPGVYTLAIGGASLTDYASIFSDVRASNAGTSANTAANNAYAADRLARSLNISGFNVTVPAPATLWLFAPLLAATGVFGRRKA